LLYTDKTLGGLLTRPNNVLDKYFKAALKEISGPKKDGDKKFNLVCKE
jgi:hypothetical protein